MKKLIALAFIAAAFVGNVHAETLDQKETRAETLNDVCRDGPGVTPSCDKRDVAYQELEALGVCYNPHSATHAQAWVPCDAPKQKTTPKQTVLKHTCEAIRAMNGPANPNCK